MHLDKDKDKDRDKKIRSAHLAHLLGPISGFVYDAVHNQPYISVPKTSEFQSDPRVVKMVLNTQCYQYL